MRARLALEVKASSDHVLDVLVAHPHMLRDLVSDAHPSLSHHVDEALDSCEGQEGELALQTHDTTRHMINTQHNTTQIPQKGAPESVRGRVCGPPFSPRSA